MDPTPARGIPPRTAKVAPLHRAPPKLFAFEAMGDHDVVKTVRLYIAQFYT